MFAAIHEVQAGATRDARVRAAHAAAQAASTVSIAAASAPASACTSSAQSAREAFASDKTETLVLSAKFESDRAIPLLGIRSLVRQLSDALLSYPAERLDRWRRRIAKVIDADAALVLSVFSDLKVLLQPADSGAGEAKSGERRTSAASARDEAQAVEAHSSLDRIASRRVQAPSMEMESYASNPGTVAARIASAFSNILRVVASHRLCIVVAIDDIQWADDASIELLAHLTQLHVKHIALALTFRSNELFASGASAAKLVQQIRQAAAVEDVKTPRLISPPPVVSPPIANPLRVCDVSLSPLSLLQVNEILVEGNER
jgi:hypothetical protein